VTSDRDIAVHAWASGSVPISSENFMHAIERMQTEKRNMYEEEYDEEYVQTSRKGNPRKLSKKEKAIKNILSKL
jgi:hypothetical protein